MNKKGFTLAEVLITLLIIGVVASLVIPSLINNTNKTEYVTKLKKEYALLSQAYNSLAMDAGGSILNDSNFNSSAGDATTDANAMNEFATKLNVVKDCGNNTGCWYASPVKFGNGTIDVNDVESSWSSKYGKAILSDGTNMAVDIFNGYCKTNPAGSTSPIADSVCGAIYIDINGINKPNTEGKDFFMFWITRTGIYPQGIFNDGTSCTTGANWATSAGCAGKVLTEGAMNY